MVRYAEWREAHDPSRSFAWTDEALQVLGTLAAGGIGLLGCGVGAILTGGAAWRALGDRALLKRVERLRDVPSRYGQHACRLTLEQSGIAYGRDEGVLTLVDGELLYEGLRTSFSIPRSDAGLGHLANGNVWLSFPTPVGDCRARLRLLDVKNLDYRGWAWGDSGATGSLVFPPYTPQPDTSKMVRRQAWTAGLLGLLGVGMATEIAWEGSLAGAAFYGVLFVGSALAMGAHALSMRMALGLQRRRVAALLERNG